MTIKNLFATLAAAVAFSGVAFAEPILPPSVTVDPTNVGAPRTAFVGQQVCPNPDGANNCFTARPHTNPANNIFTINMLSAGLFDASATPSITGGGTFNSFSFILRDAAMNVLANGNFATIIDDFFLTAGAYTMEVLYSFDGLSDNGSASWSMTLSTGVRRQVPEPATLALMGLALTGLALMRRRRS